MKGIETCEQELHGGQILLLHNILYVSDIQWNLISMVSLLKLNFSMNFILILLTFCMALNIITQITNLMVYYVGHNLWF